MSDVNSFEIVIVELTGNKTNVTCTSTTTILQIKEMIEVARGHPVDDQRFIYAGRQLSDQMTLSDYGITEPGTRINLVRKLRGS